MRDLGKIIVAKGLKKLPKVQKIAQSGHTDAQPFEGLAIQFFNGTLTASFSFFFSLFKQPLYNFYNNMMWKMYIQYMLLGFEPMTSWRESPPIPNH